MRIVSVEYKVYKLQELSEKAKEVAHRKFIELTSDCCGVFTVDCMDLIKEKFPNSDLQVQYSLNYCQGDGLNIYGKFNIMDIINNISDEIFSKEDKEKFDFLFSDTVGDIVINENRRYSYCTIKHYENLMFETEDFGNYDDTEDFLNCIFDKDILKNKGINVEIVDNLIKRFDKAAKDYIFNLCGELEELGYNFFYPSMEEFEITSEANDWEYLENGKLFIQK